MSDETTPQDDAAMPPASDGSVGEPVAWAVYSHWYAAPYIARDEQEAKRVRKGTDWIVPLYPHAPSLHTFQLTPAQQRSITKGLQHGPDAARL